MSRHVDNRDEPDLDGCPHRSTTTGTWRARRSSPSRRWRPAAPPETAGLMAPTWGGTDAGAAAALSPTDSECAKRRSLHRCTATSCQRRTRRRA